MKFNLFINYYVDKNSERRAELNFCILENLRNKSLNSIILICSEADYKSLRDYVIVEEGIQIFGTIIYDKNKVLEKIIPVITELRPTFNDYFRLMNKFSSTDDNVNIIANLDIIIPEETLNNSLNYIVERSKCLALSRYDVKNRIDYKNNSEFWNHADSQDVWMFMGAVRNVVGADNTLGIAGIDNSIAYYLEQSGYVCINPSLTLKTYHLHLCNIRNYINETTNHIQRIPPPYKLLTPSA